MKLKLTREHYQTTDNGKTWTPKIGYDTDQEIKDKGFNLRKWHIYRCGFCEKLHVAKINRGKSLDEY